MPEQDRALVSPRNRPGLRDTVVALALAAAVLTVSGYLELLGHRIVQPELRFTRAWGSAFVLGALRTAVGAAFVGLVWVGGGRVFRPARGWVRRHWALVWSAGATSFLVGIAALIAWAP